MISPRILPCILSAALGITLFSSSVTAESTDTPAHDTSRDIQTEGVGNPFGYGERNTPADASTAEIRAINHAMSVQEVKYSLYKEIDEHWALLSVRLGQTEREKVYAFFLGMATRESTLGGNGDGADVETCYADGFGVNAGHAYGPLQTAVTAFADCDPGFMPEDDVPEMYQYSLTESNFYDCMISNHMGIRKTLHFVRLSIVEDGQSGYQVLRGALKGFNTGYVTYDPNDTGYYKNYSDEVIAQAQWYYEEGHLYDNAFSWTGDSRIEPYRQQENVWDWWGSGEPSLAEIPTDTFLLGDVDLSGGITVADAVLLHRWLIGTAELSAQQGKRADLDSNGTVDVFDAGELKRRLCAENE